MKPIAAIVAIIISSIGYIPYIRDSIKGKTKPHVMSWFVWALNSYLAFGVQLANQGGAGAYINLYMGIICTVIFILGLRNGTKNITVSDAISFVIALIATFVWLVIKQPLVSILLVVLIDFLSFYPTIRKSWHKPEEETLVTWLLSCVKHALSIYALTNVTIVTTLYPLYSFLVNFGFCIMLYLRRKAKEDFKE